MHCPGNHDYLSMDTVLYQGFGGYDVTKDGKHYYHAPMDDWSNSKKLTDIEEEAVKDPDADWRINLNLPLRSGVWQRHGKDKWVLIESGLGFA